MIDRSRFCIHKKSSEPHRGLCVVEALLACQQHSTESAGMFQRRGLDKHVASMGPPPARTPGKTEKLFIHGVTAAFQWCLNKNPAENYLDMACILKSYRTVVSFLRMEVCR